MHGNDFDFLNWILSFDGVYPAVDFSTLRAAAIRQQVALQQQTSPANASASPVDAFIAVYDNRNVRIVIFFNLEKNDYKILVGDKVVYF